MTIFSSNWRAEHQRAAVRRALKRHHGKRRELLKQLKAKPCADCQVQYQACVMDFDHREGEVKLFNIGRDRRPLKAILTEAAKCDVVCANCHRLRTAERRTGSY